MRTITEVKEKLNEINSIKDIDNKFISSQYLYQARQIKKLLLWILNENESI